MHMCERILNILYIFVGFYGLVIFAICAIGVATMMEAMVLYYLQALFYALNVQRILYTIVLPKWRLLLDSLFLSLHF